MRETIERVIRQSHDFHHHRKDAEIWQIMKRQGIQINKKINGLGAKRFDGLLAHGGTKVAIKIESSTIENAYNDTLKILAAKKIGAIKFGVIIAKYNRSRKSLSYEHLKSDLGEPYSPLIANELAIICVK